MSHLFVFYLCPLLLRIKNIVQNAIEPIGAINVLIGSMVSVGVMKQLIYKSIQNCINVKNTLKLICEIICGKISL